MRASISTAVSSAESRWRFFCSLGEAPLLQSAGGGSEDGLRSLKDNLPRLLWPLLPDGERDFATRVRDFGQEKFLAMLGACLFIGCGMVSVLGGISFVSLYILYSLVHSL